MGWNRRGPGALVLATASEVKKNHTIIGNGIYVQPLMKP